MRREEKYPGIPEGIPGLASLAAAMPAGRGDGPEYLEEALKDIEREVGALGEDDLGPPREEAFEPELNHRPRLTGRGKSPQRGKRLVKPEEAERAALTPQQRLLILNTWRRSGLPAGDFAAPSIRCMPGRNGSRNKDRRGSWISRGARDLAANSPS